MNDLRKEQINRLYEELKYIDPGTDEFEKVQGELREFERMDLEEQKIENSYTVESWRQYGADKSSKRDMIKLGVQTATGITIAMISIFATETRILCKDVGQSIQNAFRFLK